MYCYTNCVIKSVFGVLNQKGWFSFLFIVGAISLLLLAVQTTLAADNAPSTKGLTLSPIRSELEIEPGRSLDRTLKLINYSDQAMTVRLSAEKFSVTNQQYDYAFSAESDTAKWIIFSKDQVHLEPGKSEKIPYNIGVPLNAEPGGRYISLFATTDTIAGDSGVKSRQRVASLVYLTVMGKVSRVGHVVSLTSPWAITGSDSWSVALQNTGTTHFRSRYDVEVQNLIGNVMSSASGDALILPSTVRLVSDELPPPSLPGVYKIVYKIGLGDAPAVSETRYLLYMPSWASLLLILLIPLLVWLPTRMRSRKH